MICEDKSTKKSQTQKRHFCDLFVIHNKKNCPVQPKALYNFYVNLIDTILQLAPQLTTEMYRNTGTCSIVYITDVLLSSDHIPFQVTGRAIVLNTITVYSTGRGN